MKFKNKKDAPEIAEAKETKTKEKKPLPKPLAWMKKHLVIVIIILIALIIGIVFAVRTVSAKKKMAEFANMPSLTEVKSMDISKTVSMTGTIEPIDDRTVYAQVNQIKIDSIEVEVGQYVNAGDILMKYDADDLEKNLSDAEKEAALTDYKSDYNIIKNARSKDDAQWQHDRLVERYTAQLQNYRDFYNALCYGNDEFSSGEKVLSKYASRYAALDLHAFSSENSKWTAVGENPENVYTDEVNTTSSLPIHKRNDTEVGDDKYEYEYEYDYNEVVAVFTRAMWEIEKDYLELINTLDDQLADAQFNLNVANMEGDISDDKTAEKVQDAQDDLNDAIVYAPISGIVTNICVEEGDRVYSSDQSKTTLCIIQDTSAFKVVGTVDEYDISKLSTGLKAVVKTDSTGDEEFEGKVTFVGVTPGSTTSTSTSTTSSVSSSSSGGNSSSSSTSYRVELELSKFDERLRSGMTGKTSIILQEETGALCVPYDSINTDEETGQKYINVSTQGGNFERKDVEVVLDSDYYVAIKADGLKEGDMIQATAASADDMSDMPTMGVSFGMGGGPGGRPGR